MIAYRSKMDSDSHVAMVCGNLEDCRQPVLVRMHTRCIAGDVFGANTCECSANLRRSLDRIAAEAAGAVIYLHQNATGVTDLLPRIRENVRWLLVSTRL